MADYKCAGCGREIHNYTDDWSCRVCGCITAEKVRAPKESATMTADIELPPLPAFDINTANHASVRVRGYTSALARDYARTCVEANTEALRSLYLMAQNHGVYLTEKLAEAEATTEALRAEVRQQKGQIKRMAREEYDMIQRHKGTEARAERLVEALRDYFNDPHADAEVTLRKLSALLHEQENDDA